MTGLLLPINAGDTIGWDVAVVAGRPVDRVPVVAAASVRVDGSTRSTPFTVFRSLPGVALLVRIATLLLRTLVRAFL